MARDNRQHNFDNALARSLRANAATAPRSGNSCADAETLAAYHERLLPADEMTSWKQHISGCTRCQEILAALEETDVIPLDSSSQAAAPEAAANITAGKTVLQIPARRPKRSWIWLAPAGAIAAALLVWITVRSPKPPAVLESKRIELAQNRPPATPVPEASAREIDKQDEAKPNAPDSRGARDSSNDRLRSAERSSRTVNILPDRNAARESIPSHAPSSLQSGALAAPRPKPAQPPAGAGKNAVGGQLQTEDSRLSARLDDQIANLPSQGRDSTSLSTLTGAGTPAPPPPPAAAPAPEPPVYSVSETVEVTSGAQAVAVSKPDSKQALAKKEKTQQLQQMQGMSRFKDAPIPSAGVAGGPIAIPSPKGKVVWRVSAAGKIERSTDSGATWSPQTSGVTTDLLAGSASSDKVCWVAGRLGTLLRTTDGGARWTKLNAPVQDDLSAIFAAGAKRAVLFTQNGSYQTTDGGRTWTRLDVR